MANPFITFFNFVKGAWDAAKTLQKINMVLTAATLTVGVKGFMQQRAMMAKGQDILAQKTAAGGKLPVVYGNRRIGSQVIFMDTASNNSTHLYVVYALSVGELEEINLQTLEIDGNPLTDSNQFRNGGYLGSDKISSGAGSLCTANQNSGSVNLTGGTFGTNPALGGYRYVFNAHHGAATQVADPMLRASIGSKWTTAHKLNGVAFIAASFIYDSKGQFSGVPQITVQVKGKKVYDQRKDSTNGGTGTQRLATASTYGWSDNPAIIFQDYILNSEYGKGIPSSQINFTTFTTAANKADTEVDQPYFNGTAKALTWSGNAGDNFITILGSEESWWQNKVGELLSLFDANGNNVLDAIEITEARRNGFFDESSVDYKVFIGATLSQTYSSQNGTSLVKVKRFHCNGYLDANKNVMDNAKDLLANMRGIFLYIDGKYELQIEDTGSSTFNISDDHIIADAGINIDYGNKDKKANKVIVEFFNANKKYELDTATVFHSAVPNFTSDDGNEELEIKAEFSYITDPYIAHNMAKAILTRSRNQTTIQFLGTPEMYKLNVGDIVNVTYSGLNLNGRIFRVEALELQANGLVSVSLIEYFDVYSWEVPPEEPVEALQDIPSAYAVKAPTNITFTDTDSSSTGRPFLAWDLPTDYPYYQWRINVKDSSGNQQINKIVDVNNCDLNFLPVDSNYIASITALNTMGVESSPATLTFTIGDAPTGTPDIKDNAIVTAKLPDSTGTSDGVTGAKIANLAITNAKINDLNATKITAGTINTARLNVTDIITAGNIIVDGDNISDLTNDSAFINGGQVNTNVTAISGGVITTGTVNTARLNVADIISTGSIIVTGSNISNLTNNSGFVDASGAASAAPVQSVAGSTGAVSASTIITAGNIVVQGDNISDLTNNSSFINGAAVNSNVTNISGGAIQTGTVAAARIDVSGVISAGSIIVSSNLTDGSTSISGGNINTGTINANRLQIDDVTIDTDGNGNLIIKSNGVDTAQIKDDAITDAKVLNLNASKITAGSIDSARINVDTLAVKKFADVSSTIISQTGGNFPLEVFGSVFQRASTNFSTQTTATGTYLSLAIGSVRNGAKYRAILSGVYGDCSGGFLEYSIDGSNYVQAAGGIQSITFAAGTFRTYVIVYSGTISGMSSSQSTVSWRLRWTTQLRSTYQSLYVFIDNTQ